MGRDGDGISGSSVGGEAPGKVEHEPPGKTDGGRMGLNGGWAATHRPNKAQASWTLPQLFVPRCGAVLPCVRAGGRKSDTRLGKSKQRGVEIAGCGGGTGADVVIK